MARRNGVKDGGMTAAQAASLAAAVPSTRAITAGAGLTGGGALSADRTIDVVANADGSLVVAANDVKVGVLATDAQHGVRGGGTQHPNAVPAGAAGFMTGADKTKLDGLPAQGGSFTGTFTGTHAGAPAYLSSARQVSGYVVSAGAGIQATELFQRLSPAADVLVTAAPSFAGGADGQIIFCANVTDFAITFQDENLLTGSLFRAPGGGYFTIPPRGCVAFVFNGGDGLWHVAASSDGFQQPAVVTTTDATQTTLMTFVPPNNRVSSIKATVIGRKSDGSVAAAFDLECAVRKQAGTTTLMGTVSALSTMAEAGSATWAATFDINANAVRIRVTGQGAATINWTARVLPNFSMA